MRVINFLICFSLIVSFSACIGNDTLFTEVSSGKSGIDFSNNIVENDTINPLDITNIYNGGGVGVGDFNNDGLEDLYFTGNIVSNKLYLNKGDFKFEDITDVAKVDGNGEWCRGVAVVDINNDGLQDIYVCATLKHEANQRKNLLYINQGNDKNNVPHFKEMAETYGLADTGQSTQAAFFDYDNDGDLDAYVVTNAVNTVKFPDNFHPVLKNGENPSTGRLYRNDWSDSLKHPFFTDVSKQAGIQTEGYGHSVNITDINQDGWKDIYVTNDFISNDLLWINNHDGTFTEELSKYFKHTSANAMGNDIVDINNDGLADVVALDMDPEDNFRKKMMLNSISYQRYQNSDRFGYNYQYVRNTLQLNQGPRVGANDSIGVPAFSDIGFFAGMAETDWSWTPLVTDFDNDGNRDIIVTNGYPKDLTDHDFISYRNQATNIASKKIILQQIPEVKLHNYAFKNNADLTFSDVTNKWGLSEPTFSNGAVYVDLDNDGDLDVVINNINSEAIVYNNSSRQKFIDSSHYLKIQFAGDSKNKNGVGAYAYVYYDHGKIQFWENTPYRGYLSSVDSRAQFGLGKTTMVDSVVIKWPNGKKQSIPNIKADQLLKVNINDAKIEYSSSHEMLAKNTLFKDFSDSVNIHYVHHEKDFVDFNIQKLLPHKFSEFDPALAAGDVDNNGLDDLIIGGSIGYSAQIFLQQSNGHFIQRALTADTGMDKKKAQDLGILLFDADKDGDPDLYIASGGYQNNHNDASYRDRFYINDGKGIFKEDTTALAKNLTSKFCVRAIDYDKDGDLDLFVAGRVDPWNYPKPVSSFIFRNDTKNGKIQFTDVTASVAKDLNNIGLVCDAVFTDFDNDGWTDIVLAGEWMPITFLKNDKGVFKNVSSASGINNQIGWWNTIAPGDFDNDGDIDYIAGNVGENSFYKASDQYPIAVYAKDFDNNGNYDAIPALYLPTSMEDQTKREFPAYGRDDLIKQMIAMRSRFQSYRTYANATMDSVLLADQRKDAIIYHANNLKSCYIRNDGNGKFTLQPLPMQAQLSMLCGMAVEDFDGDGNLDVVINGNDYGTDVSTGRYDALNGLFMKGDGKGNFVPQTILQSGIYIPGNGKALVKLRSKTGSCLLAASQNRGPLKIFKLKRDVHCIALQPNDISAVIQYRNGKTQKQECYYGSSFLSQSARFINADNTMASVIITDANGNQRKIVL
ncbi:RNA-binding protein [Panacibacter ginsenosidivorans]|uniref:RNA-binding protein n=1 Tax=Panacibacter ginsenosidivorans TaxID=1813871 RepID=A0A5B8VC09_9BACT|nr:VCBS repeat-containing protein [Panacibacter ginsenosidivorans]QEC68471.1 RNA-binding protein [Panacibacter ginsenosidivorans]